MRAVPLPDSGTRRKAIEVLESHFGESRWDPRMRLRLADLLLKAGKEQDAIPILIGLADELARAGFADKAVAILKKIEQVQRRNVEVVNLAPLLRAEAPPAAKVAPDVTGLPAPAGRARAVTDDRFHGWLVDLVRDSVGKLQPQTHDGGRGLQTPEAPSPADAPALRAYGPGLLANPLFEDFSEEELVAFIQGLKLLMFEPGDVIISEGEPGQSVLHPDHGPGEGVRARARPRQRWPWACWERDPSSARSPLCPAGRAPPPSPPPPPARSWSWTASRSTRSARAHPRVRSVLEAFSAARSADPERGAGPGRARFRLTTRFHLV